MLVDIIGLLGVVVELEIEIVVEDVVVSVELLVERIEDALGRLGVQ